MGRLVNDLRKNYKIYLSLLLVLMATILSYRFLHGLYYEYTNQFREEGNIFISGDGLVTAQTLRELNLIHLSWAFIKVFITWAISFSLISVLKISRNK